MKRLFLFLIFCAGYHFAQSQAPFCGENYLSVYPAAETLHEELEQQAFQFFSGHQPATPDANKAVLTIPVVVHIIHNNGPENISDAQVQQAIAWLNDAFANAGYYDQGSGTDVGVQFCLAQRPPDGLATNGITRNQNALTEITQETEDLNLKNINRWNTKQYLNIWVVRDICSSSAGCGVVGYAYRPEYHGTTADGLVIEAQFFGAAQSTISVVAHEIGHYLGLYHTFDGGCTNNNCLTDGDRICDTPPDQSTAAVPCGQTVNTCSTDAQSGFTSDQPDMTHNFLDYGDINCFHDFTPGQAARMAFFLNGIRHSLLDSKGCLPPCASPVVSAFSADATTIVPGQAVTFTNASQNAASYHWSINGSPFSTAANPTYVFPTNGTYTVTLLAQPGDPALCDPATSQVVIQVFCGVVADFTLSNPTPAANEPVLVTNTSQNATTFAWTVNGVAQGSSLPSVSFPQTGVYIIELIASNGACENHTQQQVFVQDSCTNKTFQMLLNSSEYYDESEQVVLLADNTFISFSKESVATKFTNAGVIIWAKKIVSAENAFADKTTLCATADGGFAVTQSVVKNLVFHYGQVIKVSANGTVEWNRNFKEIYFSAIKTDKSGNIIAYGSPFSSPKGVSFVKLDVGGNLIWTRSFEYAPFTGSMDFICLTDGGIVATAYNTISNTKSLLIRLDSEGNLIWVKNLQTGSYKSSYNTIIAAPDNSLYLVGGVYTQALTINASVIKLNTAGQFIWAKRYTGTDDSVSLHFVAGTDAKNGGIVMVGTTRISINSFYGSIAGISSNGNVSWQRHYQPNYRAFIEDVVTLDDGNGYLMSGYAEKDGLSSLNYFRTWLLKTDVAGIAGDCNLFSFPLQTADLPITDSLVTFTEVVQPVPESSTASTIPVSVQPDLLCGGTCPGTPEICGNSLDDDGDGLFDCLDPDCPCTEDVCQPKRNNHWYFGTGVSLDFSKEPATLQHGGLTYAGIVAATMNDVQGNLLFYSEGGYIYNRSHQIMPHGTSPYAGFSSDNTCLIIPHPGNPALYYIFIHDQHNFTYSVVDMHLDHGRGDVVSTESFVGLNSQNQQLEGLTATRSCSFDGYWVAVNRFSTRELLAYRIDQNGLNVNPVISPNGDQPQTMTQITRSRLKFSPNGNQLARIVTGNVVVLCTFDPGGTGQFSDPRRLPLGPSVDNILAVEYSPGGQYLYVSCNRNTPFSKAIYQFDLEAGDLTAITNSKVEIATDQSATNFTDLQLTPNGQVFVAGLDYQELHIIHRPDAHGLACQFQKSALTLPLSNDNQYRFFTRFSNCITSDFRRAHVAFAADAPDSICILNSPITYQIPTVGCDVDSIKWVLVGLPGVVVADNQKVTVTYSGPGEGQLIVTVHTVCGSASDTLPVTVYAGFNKILDLGPDRILCDNGVFTFNAGSGFNQYRWQDGSPDSTLTTLLPGKYWVDVYDACGNRQTDTVTVSISPASVLKVGPDQMGCPGLAATFERPAAFAAWQWSPAAFLSCDTCTTITADPAVTTTWTVLAQTADGCLSLDTLHWDIINTLLVAVDTTICIGQTVDFYGVTLPADTTAQFLRTNSGVGCDTLLTVQVMGLEAYTATQQVQICPDQHFVFRGTALPADTTAVFHLPGAGCDSVLTVEVKSFPPIVLVLPADTSFSIGAQITLPALASGDGPLLFQWQPGTDLSCVNCLQPIASPLDTITYTLLVTDGHGCSAGDSITLRVNPDCQLIIPNAFTPNGDQVNDWFYPIATACVRNVRLWRVVNRWGQVVFERRNFAPNQENLGWDGQWQGKPAASDVLVWMAELEYFDGRVEIQWGEVVLLR